VNNTSPQQGSNVFETIFAQLNPQEVEEFYKGYHYWNVQHQIETLQYRLNDVRKQITENTIRIQELQPTAIELATLARLQSNGVSDVELLDRMLERGEMWLDRTMQRLDYLEQLDDFISDDYTQWCQHALEGAYDWIDSVLDGNALSQPSTFTASDTTEDAKDKDLLDATEELFLQKISNDEDEALMQEITIKHPSITTADLDEAVPTSEDIPAVVDVATNPEKATPALEAINPVDTISATDLPAEEVNFQEYEKVEILPKTEEVLPAELSDATDIASVQSADTVSASSSEQPNLSENLEPVEEPLSVANNTTFTNENPPRQESIEISLITEEPSSLPPKTSTVIVSRKQPNFIRRFFGKIWGS
jgi:hypothetical protein